MPNKNRTSRNTVSSTAHLVKKVDSKQSDQSDKTSKGVSKGKKKHEPPSPCTHCNSRHHSVEQCLKKQNNDLRNTIESLVRKLDAIGNGKMVYEDNSNYSDSMARSATLLNTNRTQRDPRNLDSACLNSLTLLSGSLNKIKTSSLTLQTANSLFIHSNLSGERF